MDAHPTNHSYARASSHVRMHILPRGNILPHQRSIRNIFNYFKIKNKLKEIPKILKKL